MNAEAPAPAIRAADVPAANGARWIGGGWNLVKGQPFQWLGLALGWIVITFGLLLIPFIGGVLANFLQPVFFASFAIAGRRQLAGEKIEMGDLFSGFRASVRALVNIGALLLLAELGIFALLALLGLPTTVEVSGKVVTVADYMRALEGSEWLLVLALVLTALVKGAVWFAPPLIAFHGLSTAHALRWSVYAAFSNLGAMIVYGITLTVVFMAAILPWGLGLLVALPLMVASTYAGYRDVFERS